MNVNIGVIGGGFVGKATALFECPMNNVVIYDTDKSKCYPDESVTMESLKDRDVIFIAVPTPSKDNGECYTGIVESVINNLREVVNEKKTHIVVRSTVPVGFSRENNVMFMPEFLTEKKWREDFIGCRNWVIGTLMGQYDKNAKFMNLMNKMIYNSNFANVIKHNSMSFIDTSEAEAVKYFRNNFLSTKVGVFNEFSSFCDAKGLNYGRISRIVTLDKRIGEDHTMVPGHDGKKGFGGTCLPKDLNSMIFQMEGTGLEAPILKAVKRRNIEIDRVQKDWEEDVGRAVVGSKGVEDVEDIKKSRT